MKATATTLPRFPRSDRGGGAGAGQGAGRGRRGGQARGKVGEEEDGEARGETRRDAVLSRFYYALLFFFFLLAESSPVAALPPFFFFFGFNFIAIHLDLWYLMLASLTTSSPGWCHASGVVNSIVT